MNERDLIDLLDKQSRGNLRDDKAQRLEALLNEPEASIFMEKHRHLLKELQAFGNRVALQSLLDDIHQSIPPSLKSESPGVSGGKLVNIWRGYWPITAIAASITLVVVLFTWSFNRSLQENKEDYQELRGAVQRIEKSQNAIIKDINKTKEKNVVPKMYSGTGFLFSSKGYLATSYHVIKDADSVFIENEKLGSYKANVIYEDPVSDLALLKIESDTFVMKGNVPFMISTSDADLGEDVYTLGYPREDIVFGEGSISALSGYRQNPGAYQISIPVNPGNSGGPLLNANGDLIGVISGVQTKLTGAAFAVKSKVLYEAIANDSLHEKIILPKANVLRNVNRVEQVRRWKDFVVMVRVYN